MGQVIKLKTREKPQLLGAMMQLHASDNSFISFEGRLRNSKLIKIDGATESESPVLKRGTLWPKLDFIVLPLTNTTLPLVYRAVDSRIAFSPNGIVHVQIEKDGTLAFVAYDCFHEDTVVVFCDVSTDLLSQLVQRGVLHSYSRELASSSK